MSEIDGIITVDNEGYITFVNARAVEMFGYPPDELLGKPVEVLIPERFREIHCKHGEEYAVNPQIRPMGIGKDHYGLRKDGTEFLVNISLVPTWTGGQLFVTATVRDV